MWAQGDAMRVRLTVEAAVVGHTMRLAGEVFDADAGMLAGLRAAHGADAVVEIGASESLPFVDMAPNREEIETKENVTPVTINRRKRRK